MNALSSADAAPQFVKADVKPTLSNYAYRRALFESFRLQPQLLFPISVRLSATEKERDDLMPTVMCCGLLRWALTLTRFLQLRYAAVPGANYAMRFTLLDMTYPQLVR